MNNASQYTAEEIQRAERSAKKLFGQRLGNATSNLVRLAIGRGKAGESIDSVVARLGSWNGLRVKAERDGSAHHAKGWATVLNNAGVSDPAAIELPFGDAAA